MSATNAPTTVLSGCRLFSGVLLCRSIYALRPSLLRLKLEAGVDLYFRSRQINQISTKTNIYILGLCCVKRQESLARKGIK